MWSILLNPYEHFFVKLLPSPSYEWGLETILYVRKDSSHTSLNGSQASNYSG